MKVGRDSVEPKLDFRRKKTRLDALGLLPPSAIRNLPRQSEATAALRSALGVKPGQTWSNQSAIAVPTRRTQLAAPQRSGGGSHPVAPL